MLPSIAGLTYEKQYQFAPADATEAAYVGADNGTKLFTFQTGSQELLLHTISTPNEIDTAAVTATTFSLGSFNSSPNLAFGNSGAKGFELGSASGRLRSFDYSTPWDITTGVFDQEINLGDVPGTFATPLQGIVVSADGGTIITAADGHTLQQFSLSTPYDISTASFVVELDVGGASYINASFRIEDIAIDTEGTSLLLVTQFTTLIYQLRLTTAFSLAGGVAYSGESFDYATQDPAGYSEIHNISIAEDATKVWISACQNNTTGNESVILQYAIPIPVLRKAHSARIPLRVGAGHTGSAPLRVGAGHTALMNVRLASSHIAAVPLRVGLAHQAVIRERIARALRSPIPNLQPIAAAFRSIVPLEEYVKVAAAHRAPVPLRVRAAHQAVAPLMAFVRSAHRAVFDLQVHVATAHRAVMPLLGYNQVRAGHRAVFSLLSAPRTYLSMDVSLTTAAGQALEVISWDISADEGGYVYEGTVYVDLDGFGQLAVNDSVSLDLFGEFYSLVVESKQRDRSGPVDRRYAIGLRSPTVRFDFPRAEPVTRTFEESVLAHDAVEQLLGESVTWDLVDWRIPAFRLAWEKVSPIEAARQIVQAAGGTIQTDPDGTLRIRHLYPVSPKDNYDGATPARIVDDQDDVVRAGESFEPRRLVDRLEIRDTVDGLFHDRLEFELDSGDNRAGTVHVYPSPWRTNLVVAHSSNASLRLTPLGEVTREETEVIQFVAGKASVTFPVVDLLSVTWLYVSLGGLSFDAYSTELQAATADGYSLAEVKYRTRSIDYRLESPTVDKAQLLLKEVS